MQSGILLEKCGSYWCRMNTSQAVNSSLGNGTTSTIVAIGSTQTGTDCHSTFTTWSNSSGNNIRTATCTYNAITNLYYDSGNSPRSLNNGKILCSSKGMRLPTINETSARISGGIPSYVNNTMTSTLSGTDYFFYWRGTFSDLQTIDSMYEYVRCVK